MRWSAISDQLRTIRWRWGCPGEARLAAMVERTPDHGPDLSMIRHLARCEDCRSAVAFLARMQRPGDEMEVPTEWLAKVEAATTEETSSTPARKWVPVAALAATAAAIVILFMRPFPPPAPSAAPANIAASQPQIVASAVPPAEPLKSEEQHDRGAVRNSHPAASLQLTAPSAGAQIAPGSSIRWRPINAALYYEAQLLSVDGDLLWKARVEAVETELPDNIAFPAQSKCFLVVRAYLADERTVESNPVPVVFQPRS